MSNDLLPRDVEQVVLRLCEDLASPISLGVAIRCRYGAWDELAIMRVDPKHYQSADSYWRDAAAVALLRKCQDLPTTIDRKAVAMENFWKSEQQCFRTNQRLQPYLYNLGFQSKGDEVIHLMIKRIKKIVARLLGPCPDLRDGRFGPGATYGDRGKLTTVPDKMSSRPTLTSGAMWYLVPWTGTAWAKACANAAREPEFVRGNRFTTVPKDCTKDRGIAVEPSVNLFFQLAYGQVMKERLLSAGINLRKGQDIHRRVACEASIKGHLATIDLSNASDTVSRNLVKLLLPEKWYEVLSDLRSPLTQINDPKGKRGWVLLEKFSSMGNGYTFELETVIFLAIAMAVMWEEGINPIPGVNVFTYGDDIIVPTDAAKSVITVLKYLGFSPNEGKTFLDGSFRESCGGDYFNGEDVRPYHVEEYPREPQEWIALANGLRAMAAKSSQNSEGRHRVLRRAWFSVLDAIPTNIRRLRGPEGLGDIVIHDEEDRWQVRWRHSIRYIGCFRPARFRTVGWEHWRPDVVLASALYGVGDGGPEHVKCPERRKGNYGVTPRDSVTGYKVGWVSFS
jgi:hypothetical protein